MESHSGSPEFSIVMAYYNRKVQLLETLRGFEKQYHTKYTFEVIIVDDNSDDGTVSATGASEHLRVISGKSLVV